MKGLLMTVLLFFDTESLGQGKKKPDKESQYSLMASGVENIQTATKDPGILDI